MDRTGADLYVLDGQDAGHGADDGLEREALQRGAEGEGVGAEVAGVEAIATKAKERSTTASTLSWALHLWGYPSASTLVRCSHAA